MLHFLVSWLLLGAAVWATAWLLPGFKVSSFRAVLWVAGIFGLLDWGVGWLLFHAIGVASLGLGYLLTFLTRWLVKAILLKLTDSLSSSLAISSFKVALLGALVMSLLQAGGDALLARWL